MKNIYDIRKDNALQEAIKERSQYFDDSPYVEKFGDYGTSEWWDKVSKERLIVEYDCEVLGLSGFGEKAGFPIFQVCVEGKDIKLECKGDISKYVVGERLNLSLVYKDQIFKEYSETFELVKVDVV